MIDPLRPISPCCAYASDPLHVLRGCAWSVIEGCTYDLSFASVIGSRLLQIWNGANKPYLSDNLCTLSRAVGKWSIVIVFTISVSECFKQGLLMRPPTCWMRRCCMQLEVIKFQNPMAGRN